MANKKPTILIIEDENPIRFALKDTLEKEGYAIVEAENGEVGLTKSLALHPDLILLDIVMPKKDGMTVLKELREDAWGETAHVILLTNILDDDDMLAESARLGVTKYLLKAEWTLRDIIFKIKEELSTVQKQ